MPNGSARTFILNAWACIAIDEHRIDHANQGRTTASPLGAPDRRPREVKVGQVLAMIDNRIYRSRVEQKLANNTAIAIATGRVRKSRADLALA